MVEFKIKGFEKRSWRHQEFLAIFPDHKIRIMDLGSGSAPFRARDCDEVVTVDFAGHPDCLIDVTKEWPFEPDSFDLVYASHVIEHFYPQDRDKIVFRIWETLNPGGLFFFRVPHKSSIQATGWEHHSLYGLNAAMSLCHGESPLLPAFQPITYGAARITVDGFYDKRRINLEPILNISHTLTENILARLLIGGIQEAQFLLQRPHHGTA